MNKREVVWLIVRLIGLYFSYLAILALFGLASSIWAIAWAPSAKGPETENTRVNEQPVGIPGIKPEPPARTPKPADPAADAQKREAFKEILWHIFLTLAQGGIGFYLLAYGGALFTILARENKPGEVREREPESILLNLSE